MVSTNRLLVLILILMVLIFALLIIVNYEDLKYRFSRDTSDSNNMYYTGDDEEKYYPKQDTLKVDFEGLKNDTINLPENIIQILAAGLDSFNWNEALKRKDLYSLYHETVFARNLDSDKGKDKWLIVITFSNSTANLCHACIGKISLFEFRKKNEKWQLSRKNLAFAYGDEFGFEPRGLELVRIGNKNKYAVIVHTGYSGQGHERESKLVYAAVDNLFIRVFEFTSYEYYNDYPKDIEYTEGYSDMRILESNKDYFDIETKSYETDWNDKTPGAVKHFVFNGSKYEEKQVDELPGRNQLKTFLKKPTYVR